MKLPLDSVLNLLELLGNNRQHLQVNSVEFVEAGPGTTRGQSFEHLAHLVILHIIRAIEDDTLSSEGL